MTPLDKATSLNELSDRQLLEIIFTSQVRINKRLIDLEIKLGHTENSSIYDNYFGYINDLYNSQYPIRDALDSYLKVTNDTQK